MRHEKVTKEEKADAIAHLRKTVPKGARVYGIVRKIAPSGMSRVIDFFYLKRTRGGVDPVWLTPWFRYVTSLRPEKHDRGLIVGGCGMDMILHVVQSVAHDVHGDDYAWSRESL